MKRIAVLGGSFNPPTLGHRALLCAAAEAVSADEAIFLPSSYGYVKRKLARRRQGNEALPDNIRLGMLSAMCKDREGFSVEDYEMCAKGKTYTFETLEYIREKHGGAEVFFIAGSDKLDVFPKWHRAEEFFTTFKILLASRSGDNAESILDGSDFLKKHRDAFRIFSAPEEISGISSSEVRRLFREKREEEARSLLHPEVWEELRRYYEQF